MPTIIEFLESRIAEDEEVARAATDATGWGSSPDGHWRLEEVPYEGEWPRNPSSDAMWAYSDWAIHASLHDPARVLAECAAKKILTGTRNAIAANKIVDGSPQWHELATLDVVVKALAAVYSDHPDYQQEWAL